MMQLILSKYLGFGSTRFLRDIGWPDGYISNYLSWSSKKKCRLSMEKKKQINKALKEKKLQIPNTQRNRQIADTQKSSSLSPN